MPPTFMLNARINPELVRQLDIVAAAKGTTRSELVRQGIELILAEHEDKELDNAALMA